MSMEGKRFGVGLAAGLLVALALITTAGGFGSNPASVLLAPISNGGTTKAIATASMSSTVTQTVTTTTAATATYTLSRSSGTAGGYTQQNSTLYPATSTATSTSTASSKTTSNSSNPASIGSLNSATSQGTPKYSSRIDSLATQPILSNAVILVPVLVAFLLGAFLYRISIRERAAGEEE
jgi:hypothetical protein